MEAEAVLPDFDGVLDDYEELAKTQKEFDCLELITLKKVIKSQKQGLKELRIYLKKCIIE